MNKNPLNIVTTSENKQNSNQSSATQNKRIERQARFDRLWLTNPEKFNPSRTASGRERIKRTLELMLCYIDPSEHLVADLGCASGHFTFRLRDRGANVHAIDISSKALDTLAQHDTTHIELMRDYLPKSLLHDDTYDVVFCTDLIAELDPGEYRLFFSELARIVNAEGYLVCSTPIDIYSENALQNFADLATTEFDILKWVFSYHRLHISLTNFFKAPSRFFRAWKDTQYRKKALESRYSLNKLWFKINSTALPAFIWFLVRYVSWPIATYLEKSDFILDFLERVTRLFWRDEGISHAIFIGKRRPIIPETAEESQPRERKHKKQVWE